MFFDNFTFWSPDEKNKAKNIIKKFINYIIKNFLLPRMLAINYFIIKSII